MNKLKDKTILIAEDEETNYLYLEALLEDTGAHLLWATNGAEAINKFRANPQISLMLIDLKMPLKNGFDVLEEVRSINPEIPVIAQTAYSMAEDRDKCMRAGFSDYLPKPIAQNDFYKALYRVL